MVTADAPAVIPSDLVEVVHHRSQGLQKDCTVRFQYMTGIRAYLWIALSLPNIYAAKEQALHRREEFGPGQERKNNAKGKDESMSVCAIPTPRTGATPVDTMIMRVAPMAMYAPAIPPEVRYSIREVTSVRSRFCTVCNQFKGHETSCFSLDHGFVKPG
jgi:hypothetical protein